MRHKSAATVRQTSPVVLDESRDLRGGRRAFWTALNWLMLVVTTGQVPDYQRWIKLKRRVRPSVQIFDGPFALGRNGYWHYAVALPLVRNFENLNYRQKMAARNHLRDFLSSDVMVGRSFKLWGMSQPFDIEACDRAWREQLVPGASAELQLVNERHRSYQKQILAKSRYRERRLYLEIRLQEPRGLFGLVLVKLEALLGRNILHAYGEADARFADQVKLINASLDSHGFRGARPLTQNEYQNLLRRNIMRGYDTLPPLGLPETGQLSDLAKLKRLTDSIAYDRSDHLEIQLEGQTRYVAYMALASLPARIGWEFLYQSNEYGQPVEFALSGSVQTPEKVKARAKFKHRILKETRLDLLKTEGEEDVYELDNVADVNHALREHGSKGRATVEFEAVLIPSADNLQELHDTVEFLRAEGSENGTYYDVDNTAQLELREVFHPGSRKRYRVHIQELGCRGFAKAMPHASSIFGNGGAVQGIVLGRDITPFLFSHNRAILRQNDTGTAQVVVGPLGTGKTFVMLSQAAGDAQDGFCVIMDEGGAKDDTALLKELPNVPKILHLNLMDFPGALNPGLLGDTYLAKKALISDLLQQCSKSFERHDEWEKPLSQAIERLLREQPDRPRLYDLVHWLKDGEFGPEGEALAISIEKISELPEAAIFFANDTPLEKIAEYTRPGMLTMVRFGRLKAPAKPQDDRSRYTDIELAAILCRRMSNVLYDRIAQTRELPVSIYKDEFHLDARLGGMTFFDFVARTGRALQTLITVGSQSMLDFPESMRDYVSTLIAFRQESREAASAVISWLGVDFESPAEREMYIDEIMDLSPVGVEHRKGEAIVRLHNREVGRVQFKDIYLQGNFISNARARLEVQELKLQSSQLPPVQFLDRAETRDGAYQKLVAFGYADADHAEINRRIDQVLALAPNQAFIRLASGKVGRVTFSEPVDGTDLQESSIVPLETERVHLSKPNEASGPMETHDAGYQPAI